MTTENDAWCDYVRFLQYFYNFLLQMANSLDNLLFIGEGKTQKLIALSNIVLSQGLKTTFKQNIEGEEKKSALTNCRFTTISSQISAIYNLHDYLSQN